MESPLFRVSAALGIHLIVYCAIEACLAFGLYALLQPSRTPNSGLPNRIGINPPAVRFPRGASPHCRWINPCARERIKTLAPHCFKRMPLMIGLTKKWPCESALSVKSKMVPNGALGARAFLTRIPGMTH